jgi:hypothetical protein
LHRIATPNDSNGVFDGIGARAYRLQEAACNRQPNELKQGMEAWKSFADPFLKWKRIRTI